MHIPDRDRCNWLRERIETPEEVSFGISLGRFRVPRC